MLVDKANTRIDSLQFLLIEKRIHEYNELDKLSVGHLSEFFYWLNIAICYTNIGKIPAPNMDIRDSILDNFFDKFSECLLEINIGHESEK